MKKPDEETLWTTYLLTLKDHRLTFPEWLDAQGYHIESYLQAEDADRQKETFGELKKREQAYGEK